MAAKKKGKPPKRGTPMDRELLRMRAGFSVENVIELRNLVWTTACAAYRLTINPGGPVAAEIVQKTYDILSALGEAMNGDDGTFDALHSVALRATAVGPYEKDVARARYRLPKGGRANLRAHALRIAGLVEGPGRLHPDGPTTGTLAILAGGLADRQVTPAELCAAFPNGWSADAEVNAENLLIVALGNEKAARNTMHAAKDMAERRRTKKPTG